MTNKIKPTRIVKKMEKYNCTGKLRVKVDKEDGEISEVVMLPKGGGCKSNLETIGRLVTAMLECNIDLDFILEILESSAPCTAVKDRADVRDGTLPKNEIGFGGCSRILAWAIKQKREAV